MYIYIYCICIYCTYLYALIRNVYILVMLLENALIQYDSM